MRDSGLRVFTSADTSLIGIIENSIKRGWVRVAYSDYDTDTADT